MSSAKPRRTDPVRLYLKASPHFSAAGVQEMWSCRLPPLLALLCAAATAYGHGKDERGDADKAFCSWTCAIFTLQWPAGFCQVTFNSSVG